MGTRDARVDAYINKSAEYAKPILTNLREWIHTACPDVEETMKWSAPFFMYKGILVNMAAFKEHCAVGFWKWTPEQIFGKDKGTKGKADEGMGLFGRITSVKDLPPKKKMIEYIKRAMELNESGVKPDAPKPKPKVALATPPYFTAALKKNKKAMAHFEEFSESKKREYVEWLTEAKTEATRDKRMVQALEWISEGKTRHWKYAKC